MAEQTLATPAPQQHNGENGAAMPKGRLTEAGRRKIAAAQKAHHAAHPRNTSPITPEKIQRLQALTKNGTSVKKAAESIGIGYSTAQRYVTLGDRKAATKAKRRASSRAPLTTEQLTILRRLIPKMPGISADEIAKKAKVHFSTVYTYRKAMLGTRKTAKHPKPQQTPATHGLPNDIYADFREAYGLIWSEHKLTGEEPHNAELYFARAWRKLVGRIV